MVWGVTTSTRNTSPFHTHEASLALSIYTHEERVSGNVLVLRGRLIHSEQSQEEIMWWVGPGQQPKTHLAAHALPSPAGSGESRRKARRLVDGGKGGLPGEAKARCGSKAEEGFVRYSLWAGRHSAASWEAGLQHARPIDYLGRRAP